MNEDRLTFRSDNELMMLQVGSLTPVITSITTAYPVKLYSSTKVDPIIYYFATTGTASFFGHKNVDTGIQGSETISTTWNGISFTISEVKAFEMSTDNIACLIVQDTISVFNLVLAKMETSGAPTTFYIERQSTHVPSYYVKSVSTPTYVYFMTSFNSIYSRQLFIANHVTLTYDGLKRVPISRNHFHFSFFISPKNIGVPLQVGDQVMLMNYFSMNLH